MSGADWRTTALAAAAAITVAGAAWKYLIGPFCAAIWAAIKAAPRIAEDVADLPQLIADLRTLLDANVVGEIANLKAAVAELKSEVLALKSPTIAGGEGDPGEPFLITDEVAMQRIRERLRGASHIPGPEEA